MTHCVDASAIVPWLVPHPHSVASESYWLGAVDSGVRIIAPHLVFAEATSALRRYVSAGVIKEDFALAAVADMLALPIRPVHAAGLYSQALELAARLKQSKAYDALYLALARSEKARLVTGDAVLHQHALRLGVDSLLLESLST